MNMQLPAPRPFADHWIAQVFSAQAVRKGAVVRRSVSWIEREVGRNRFEAEVRRRGFHLIESGGQFIVLCNQSGIRVIC